MRHTDNSLPRLLLVDSDPVDAGAVRLAMEQEGWEVEVCACVADALRSAERATPDVVVTGYRLSDATGIDLIHGLRENHRNIPVIMMTAHSSPATVMKAMQLGAYRFLVKPFSMAKLGTVLEEALQRRRDCHVDEEAEAAKALEFAPADDRAPQAGDIVGSGAAMQEVFERIGRVASSSIPVLIRGETGAGKEVVAKAIWQHSDRVTAPLLSVNCGAIAESLIESELFGHEKGAFTGAATPRIGRFEEADGGTLFLDEIADLPLGSQAKLLRVLEEGRIRRVGGSKDIPVDVRVLAATNGTLEGDMRAGRFRKDLFYRINGVKIEVPPLRDRPEDIPELVELFEKMERRDLPQLQKTRFPAATLALLVACDWPGNVRQLKNVIERALLEGGGHAVLEGPMAKLLLDSSHLAHSETAGDLLDLAAMIDAALETAVKSGEGGGRALSEITGKMESLLYKRALKLSGGEKTKAARWLGVSFPTMSRKMAEYGL